MTSDGGSGRGCAGNDDRSWGRRKWCRSGSRRLRVALLINVYNDFSIDSADLQRHGAIVALGVAVAESVDKATHRTYPSLAFASNSMKSHVCRVDAFYATADVESLMGYLEVCKVGIVFYRSFLS
jgi:hypothetical protein